MSLKVVNPCFSNAFMYLANKFSSLKKQVSSGEFFVLNFETPFFKQPTLAKKNTQSVKTRHTPP